MPRAHWLIHSGATAAEALAAALGTGPNTLRGSTSHFKVSFETKLGGVGQGLADRVLATCEADYAKLRGWFGLDPPGMPFKVSIVGGSFGAKHDECAATYLQCAAFDGNDADLVRMMVVAEVVEVFAAALPAGDQWDCGASNGEGLSRVLAVEVVQHPLGPFATASTWLSAPGRPNFVSSTDPSDLHFLSIGCATLFLNYLHYQLRKDWADIVKQGGLNLAATYQKLGAGQDAFEAFSALLASAFPPGGSWSLPNDNPFPLPPVPLTLLQRLKNQIGRLVGGFFPNFSKGAAPKIATMRLPCPEVSQRP